MTTPQELPTSLASAALAYAERGWPVFPLHSPVDGGCSCSAGAGCTSPGKHPRTPNGLKDATTDRRQVAGWWDKNPDANIGLVTGEPSGLVVVDIDGPAGKESLRSIAGEDLPDTLRARTGGGGFHLVFAHPGGQVATGAGFLPGLDVRADGGYIVASPSLHASGERYAWENEGEEPAALPEWFDDLVSQRGSVAVPRGEILDGQRNNALTSIGGSHRRFGRTEAEILEILREVNQERCRPPLDEDEVERIARSVARYPVDPPLTDLGNAQRLVHAHGEEMRFVGPWGSWLTWDGRRWAKDDTGAVERMAKETVIGLYEEAGREASAATSTDAEAKAKRKFKWATTAQSGVRIREMIRLAQSERRVVAVPDDLDGDPWALNVANGTLDLRSGRLRSHEPSDLLTKLAPVPYDAGARAPVFDAFLDTIFGGNRALIEYVQRCLGYALTGEVGEQVFFIAHGSGANGKSTLFEAVKHVLGDYARKTSNDLLIARTGKHPTEVAALQGVRFALASEIQQSDELDEAQAKRLTGGDTLSARRMREDFWEFRPTHKLFLAVNHLPRVRSTDHGTWRRIRVIPFEVTIPPTAQDSRLPDKLAGEASGILNWLVEGCLMWQRDGLSTPREVQAATGDYRCSSDRLHQFLQDCQDPNGGPDDITPSEEALAAFNAWSERQGFKGWSQTSFSKEMKSRSFDTERRTVDGRKRTVFVGLSLLPPDTTSGETKDHFGDFVRECLLLDPGASTAWSELRSAYEEWCGEKRAKPLDTKPFSILLKRSPFRHDSGGGRGVMYHGVSINEAALAGGTLPC